MPAASADAARRDASPETSADAAQCDASPETSADARDCHFERSEAESRNLSPAVPEYRLIGEALDTYILAECGDALWLIDKHACHERVLFDRLLAGLGETMSQTLLRPVTYVPGAEGAELLERSRETLADLGFELERFGEDAVILRAVPADCGGDELALLEELLEALRSGKPEDRRETLCHTIACKAAIKAGSPSDPRELAVLAEKALSGEVRYCPHGRPVCVRLTKTELDRQFKRIV